MNTIPAQAYIQGTPEWLSLRKTKITATDAAVILHASPWKDISQLYHEKTSNEPAKPANERMQRGLFLEPIARDLFSIKTGIDVQPMVVVKDWAMASLDGISECGRHLVEIKCPGDKDHAIAISGKVPSHYYPQLQHQMYVCNTDFMYYFSFDGADGVILEVDRNSSYIDKMVEEEKIFYGCLVNKTPPVIEEKYLQRDDYEWRAYASQWLAISQRIKELEKQEEDMRERLIFLSGQSNARGAGISLCKVQRKGNVDYSAIPELKNVDLDQYRRSSTETWRISSK